MPHQELGVGIGLRRSHFDAIFQTDRPIDWFEIVTENFMSFGGAPRAVLEKAKLKWTLVPHGVGLSIGSLDPFSSQYISELKELVGFVDAPWFSDHLCLSTGRGHHYHDLIPLLQTEESVDNIVDRIKRVQDAIGRPFAIENISYYTGSVHHTLEEADFISRILEMADCSLLLDINNVYVNSQNLRIDAKRFIDALPLDRVIQTHLAGHYDRGDVLIDTHGAATPEPVWELYRWFLQRAGRPVSTLIEWDNNIPPLDDLLDQADKARAIQAEVFEVAA